MAKAQHYHGLNTNLDRLYDDIRHELQGQKDLQIVSEYNGTMNSIPLLSDVAVNKSPKIWAGALREFCVYITRGPNYYAVEVASGMWFGSRVWTGAVGFVVGRPIGLAAEASVGG